MTLSGSEHPAPRRLARTDTPVLAAGVQPLGRAQGSGYRHPPHLVRRSDGQVVQLSPLLGALVDAIDGVRDVEAVASAAGAAVGRPLHPDDAAHLIEARLGALGLLRAPDGRQPDLRPASPLLGLRGRVRLISPSAARWITGPFLWLFRTPVVVAVVAAFVALVTWVVAERGIGPAIDDAISDPLLMLGVLGLVVASAAFHEVGHAAACRYGGAEPGAMGAAVYLVWPAFYTDVTDSYRLDRAARLRVDLGGLYFNAIFAVATGVAWLVTGVEALLVLVPVQALQMARQLIPAVRFDGYHILADLVGVPDLFGHIKPTLGRAVPWKRGVPASPLTRRAQVMVVGWVATVVPLLAVSLGMLLWHLPDVLVGAGRTLQAQWAVLAQNAAAVRPAAVALGLVAMAMVAFFPAAAAYLAGRIAVRSGRRLWTATEARPAIRSTALALGMVALVALVGPKLLAPQPVGDKRGPTTPVALGPPVAAGEWEAVDQPAEVLGTQEMRLASTSEAASPPLSRSAPARNVDHEHQPPVVASAPAASVSRTTPPPPPPVWPFPWDRPDPPGPGDNLAEAVSTHDGAEATVVAASLEWLRADQPMLNRNEAHAYASCTDCRATAVAFQVVAGTAQHHQVAPVNAAVAGAHQCERCVTSAVAVQLAVTFVEEPPAEVRGQLQALVASVNARRAVYATASPAQVLADLRATKQAALALLAPWLDAVAGATDVSEPVEEAVDTTGSEEAGDLAEPHTDADTDPTAVPTEAGDESDGTATVPGTEADAGSADDEGLTTNEELAEPTPTTTSPAVDDSTVLDETTDPETDAISVPADDPDEGDGAPLAPTSA